MLESNKTPSLHHYYVMFPRLGPHSPAPAPPGIRSVPKCRDGGMVPQFVRPGPVRGLRGFHITSCRERPDHLQDELAKGLANRDGLEPPR